jgi:hypothetical protein
MPSRVFKCSRNPGPQVAHGQHGHLGGDWSIVLGPLLALRRRGRYGLAFLDGHADFQHPSDEPNGEVALLGLTVATGSGPDLLTDLDGLRPRPERDDERADHLVLAVPARHRSVTTDAAPTAAGSVTTGTDAIGRPGRLVVPWCPDPL